MNSSFYKQIKEKLEQHEKHQKMSVWVGAAAAIVLGGTALFMSMPATTASSELICGEKEGAGHTHTADCYADSDDVQAADEILMEEVDGDFDDDDFVSDGSAAQPVLSDEPLIVDESLDDDALAGGLEIGSWVDDVTSQDPDEELEAVSEEELLEEADEQEEVPAEDIEAEEAEEDPVTETELAETLPEAADEEVAAETETETAAAEAADAVEEETAEEETAEEETGALINIEETVATEEQTEEITETATEGQTEEVTEAATEEQTEEVTEAATEEQTEEITEAATEEQTEEADESVAEEAEEEITEEETEEALESVTEAEEETESVTEAESETEETVSPAASFEEHAGNVTVTVTAPEGAFPEGTTMQVSTVKDETVLDAAINEVNQENTKAAAVDITFLDADGKEIEPAKEIQVTLQSDIIAEHDDVQIVHIDDENQASVVEQTAENANGEKTAEDEVAFTSDSFSVYVLVYTVDFYFGDYEYHLEGNASMKLSALLDALQIEKNIDGELLTTEDIENITFSNEELLQITSEENDWTLTSLQAFSSEETLTLALKNGKSVEIRVTDDASTDFKQYITAISTQKLNNGRWENTTAFNDGDGIRCTIKYSLPFGMVTTDSPTITYTLPDGVTPNKAESGRVNDEDDNEIGSYVIDEKGNISITFDEAYLNSHIGGIDAGIFFEGTVSNTSDEATKTISFGGTSTPITVTKQVESTTDIKTEKTGTINDDKTVAEYVLTTSTTKGTEGTVKIQDILDTYNTSGVESYTYDAESIVVTKIGADGTTSTVLSVDSDYQLDITKTDDNRDTFIISGLPQLSAGEKYVTTYKVNLSGVGDAYKLTNSAGAYTSKENNWTSHSIQKEKIVSKSGAYDNTTGYITWTIIVNNDKSYDVTGWNFTDENQYPIVGTVSIKGESSAFSAEINYDGKTKIDYTFPDGLSETAKYDKYTITYKTKAPEGDNSSVTNKAVFSKDGKSQEAEATTPVTHRTWGVAKTYQSESNLSTNSSIKVNTWRSELTVPEGELTTFTYTDTIADAVDEEGNSLGTSSHYATAHDLEFGWEGKLYLVVDNNTRYYYHSQGKLYANNDTNNPISSPVMTIRYYDVDGKEITNIHDGTTPVKSFQIEVTAADGSTFSAQKLILDSYTTYTDTSSWDEGATATVSNKGTINELTSEASHKITVPYALIKQVKTGIVNNANIFESGTANVDYDDDNHILTYRLLLNTTADTGTTIEVTDILPAGATYVVGSVNGYFYEDEYTWHNSNYVGTDFGNSEWKNANLSAATSAVEDSAETKLSIKLTNYTYSSFYPILALTYQVSIEDDEFWDDLKNAGKTYSNKASWNGHTVTQDTKVTREVDNLIKDGEQLFTDGNPTGDLKYYITLNPKEEDLVPDSDTIELVDELILKDTWDGTYSYTGMEDFNPTLDVSTVHLYTYDSTKENGIGEEISKELYTIAYDAVNAKLTIVFPDETACILTYQYHVNMDFASGSIFGNKATLNGQYSTSNQLQVKTSTSGAWATSRTISVYKVDSKNYGKRLAGAVFELLRWDTNTKAWATVGEYTSDSDGKITWNLSGSNPDLSENTLYRLVETKAPDNYACDSSPYYFVYMGKENDETAAKQQSGASTNEWSIQNGSKEDADYRADNVIMFKHTGSNMLYVPNDSTVVSVKKVWTDANGVELTNSNLPDVEVKLKRSLAKKVGYSVTLNLSETDWQGLVTKTTPMVIEVAKGSSLTFNVINYLKGENETVKISIDGGSLNAWESLNNERSWTIDNVNHDMVIAIESQYATVQLEFSNYSDPTWDVSDATDYATATLKASENWTHVWNNLDKTDDSGNKYYYSVEEVNIPRGYSVTYRNNAGIQNGQITINNQKGITEEYELPSTGGPGTFKYIFSGMTLIMIALLFSLRRRFILKGGT